MRVSRVDSMNRGQHSSARVDKTRRRAAEPPTSTVCDICGLRATPQKPLVHASYLTDEVPF